MRGCNLRPELARGKVELVALGDFTPSNDSAEVLPVQPDEGALGPLRFPVATRAVEARIAGPERVFFGYSERGSTLGLDVLLWPQLEACAIWPARGRAGYPGRGGGQALGYEPQAGLLLAAGGNDPLVSDSIVGALLFDARTGAARALDSSAGGALREPRAFATATGFGKLFLVAGGEQPVFGLPERDVEPLSTAEIFDPSLGRFTGETIQLRNSRTHHAAVTLDDGRTLLVGGRSKVNSRDLAQYQLETVDPLTRQARIGDATTPRIEPRVLRLSDGRIFIGGGVGLDGALSLPVAEWLSPEGKLQNKPRSPAIPPRFERAFVAMSGGGVLAVGGCEDRPAGSAEDAERCAASCSRGCPPLGGYDAWWLAADGAATQVSLDGISAPRPILLPGSDGSPWLVAANLETASEPRLFRFDPWAQRFVSARVPEGIRVPRPGTTAPVAIDTDTFVWIDDERGHGELVGMRLSTRNRYVQDQGLVLLYDPEDPRRPQHLVPDRPLGRAARYAGALELFGAAFRAQLAEPDFEPDVTIRVADADYADVTVKLRVKGDALPLVVLGDALLGGPDCPWPEGSSSGGDFDSLTVARKSTRAELRFRGAARVCSVKPGRLTLGLRANSGASVVTQLDVLREGASRRP